MRSASVRAKICLLHLSASACLVCGQVALDGAVRVTSPLPWAPFTAATGRAPQMDSVSAVTCISFDAVPTGRGSSPAPLWTPLSVTSRQLGYLPWVVPTQARGRTLPGSIARAGHERTLLPRPPVPVLRRATDLAPAGFVWATEGPVGDDVPDPPMNPKDPPVHNCRVRLPRYLNFGR